MEIKHKSEIPAWEEVLVWRELPGGTTLRAEPSEKRKAPETSPATTRTFIPDDRTYWVGTTDGKIFEFSGDSDITNRKNATIMAMLWGRSGGFKIVDDGEMVPVKVAVLGKPSIAAYLDVVQDMDRKTIAEKLDVSTGTVDQYISKVRRGHR